MKNKYLLRNSNPLAQKKKASNFSEFLKKDSEDSGDSDFEDALRVMGFSMDKSLEVGKEKDSVLTKGIYKGQQLSQVAKFITSYLKNVKIIGCRQANKRSN